jgi:hypothetical protein
MESPLCSNSALCARLNVFPPRRREELQKNPAATQVAGCLRPQRACVGRDSTSVSGQWKDMKHTLFLRRTLNGSRPKRPRGLNHPITEQRQKMKAWRLERERNSTRFGVAEDVRPTCSASRAEPGCIVIRSGMAARDCPRNGRPWTKPIAPCEADAAENGNLRALADSKAIR